MRNHTVGSNPTLSVLKSQQTKAMKIYKQETKKSCGVACLRSIINHYGNNLSEKDIWEKHDHYSSGETLRSPIISLGLTALKFDLRVIYYNYHPIIVNNNAYKNLKKSLEIKSKDYYDFGKYYVDKALEFVTLGGQIKFNKLGVSKIKDLLDENNFALIEIKPAFINNNGSINMNHKVIINGYNKEGFKILDPSGAKEYVLDFETFLLAFYAAVPELLIIKTQN
jgi:hypothetical protein